MDVVLVVVEEGLCESALSSHGCSFTASLLARRTLLVRWTLLLFGRSCLWGLFLFARVVGDSLGIAPTYVLGIRIDLDVLAGSFLDGSNALALGRWHPGWILPGARRWRGAGWLRVEAVGKPTFCTMHPRPPPFLPFTDEFV